MAEIPPKTDYCKGSGTGFLFQFLYTPKGFPHILLFLFSSSSSCRFLSASSFSHLPQAQLPALNRLPHPRQSYACTVFSDPVPAIPSEKHTHLPFPYSVESSISYISLNIRYLSISSIIRSGSSELKTLTTASSSFLYAFISMFLRKMSSVMKIKFCRSPTSKPVSKAPMGFMQVFSQNSMKFSCALSNKTIMYTF